MTAETSYLNPSMCSTCGGLCCQRLPGIYHPEDFERIFEHKLSVDLLVAIFHTGKVAVDSWVGDPRYDRFKTGFKEVDPEDMLDQAYYLRPKGIKALDKLVDTSWRDNRCINWEYGTGCTLAPENKPYQCKKLVPEISPKGEYVCTFKESDKCDKQDMSILWVPYQSMIEEAIKIYESNNN